MPASKVTVEASFVEIEPVPSELPFTDVAADAWYHDAVAYVYDNGMMNGVTENTFAPNATTTRGMIVTMLHRLEGEPGVNYLLPFGRRGRRPVVHRGSPLGRQRGHRQRCE